MAAQRYSIVPILLFLMMVFAGVDAAAQSSSTAGDALLAQWRETLKYGINSEIVDLIDSMKQRNDDSLNKDLITTFSSTYDDKVRSAILDLYSTLSFSGAEDAVRTYLGSRPDNTDLEIAAISYLSRTIEHPSKETVTLLESYVDSPTEAVSNAAVRGLGAVADRNGPAVYDFSALEKRLLDHVSHNDLSETAMGDAILTLGDLKAEKAVEPLLEVVTDTTQPAVLRQYAADSLGKIGDAKAIPVLSELIRSPNAYLRAYGVSALGRFNTRESGDAVSAALRDSAPGVRIAALQGIARNRLADQGPAVIYKAEHDPDIHVRTEAIKTLGALGTSDGWKLLQKMVEQSGASLDLRTAALAQLVKGDLGGSIDSLKKVIQTEWAARDKHMLYATGQALSKTKSPLLSGLYELLLSHPDYIVQIYALRGIALNRITGLRGSVERLRGEQAPAILGREVDRVLQALGAGASTPSP